MKNILPCLVFLLGIQACQKDEPVTPEIVAPKGPTVTDIDGNVYHVIRIGNQTWMQENLKVTHYRNGDPIPNITEHADWINQTEGAYCNYHNSNMFASTYGRLYNFHAVKDERKLAPEGWRIPTNEDWMELEFQYGGVLTAGPLKETGTTHWASPNIAATNESGFTAVPGGSRGDEKDFNQDGIRGYWWNTSESFAHFAWFRTMSNDESMLNPGFTTKTTGMSVRCIKE